jgi:hypothetical protein
MSHPHGPFCQSCSMPMTKQGDFGTNADGTQNDQFCLRCFRNGRFTEPGITVEGMIEKCTALMKQMHLPDEEIEQTRVFIPMLKRWKR